MNATAATEAYMYQDLSYKKDIHLFVASWQLLPRLDEAYRIAKMFAFFDVCWEWWKNLNLSFWAYCMTWTFATCTCISGGRGPSFKNGTVGLQQEWFHKYTQDGGYKAVCLWYMFGAITRQSQLAYTYLQKWSIHLVCTVESCVGLIVLELLVCVRKVKEDENQTFHVWFSQLLNGL